MRRPAPTVHGAVLRVLVVAVLLAGATAAPASAASVAYIEGGNVWLSSPDGTKKVQLTTDGTPQKGWLGVSQAADGRTAAVYNNDPNGNARLQRLVIFSPLGAKVGDYTLQAPSVANVPNPIARPLAFEISDDGEVTANEFSYCTGFGITYCQTVPRGTWYTTTNTDFGLIAPFETSGARQGTFFGRRLVHSDGSAISIQDAPNAPFTDGSAPWISPAAGFEFKRADVASTGNKVALESYRASPPAGVPNNVIGIVPFSGGAGAGSVLAPQNGCDLPAAGNAFAVSWSPDGSQIAWRDSQGLKVAGTPVLPATTDACTFTSPPVLITSVPPDASPDSKDSTYLTSEGPSFGGADVAAIIAARTPAPGGGGSGGGGGGAAPPRVTITAPARITATAFTRGVVLRVRAVARGRIDVVATIPRSVARRLKLPTTIARGRGTARRAGQIVTVRLVPVAAAKRAAKRLRRVKVTVRASQGARRTTVVRTLR